MSLYDIANEQFSGLGRRSVLKDALVISFYLYVIIYKIQL